MSDLSPEGRAELRGLSVQWLYRDFQEGYHILLSLLDTLEEAEKERDQSRFDKINAFDRHGLCFAKLKRTQAERDELKAENEHLHRTIDRLLSCKEMA